MVRKQPLKRALVGFESEFFTINKKGNISHNADAILKRAKKERKDITLEKECSKNVIEVASPPNEKVPHSMEQLLTEIEGLLAVAEKEDTLLLPAGCYPGSFNPHMRTEKGYKIKESIFGKTRYKIAGRVCGFHCHYSLPKGVFDESVRMIKMLVNSKIKDSMVSSYNLLIAADPALTTFMQSSPFYQGKYMGKASRVIMYRGGKRLDNPGGLYTKFQYFGGLPPYRYTALDIMDVISTRYEKWRAHIQNVGLNIKSISQYGSILNTTWNPVKINANGTLEQRGMDMNHPAHIAGIGIAIKHVLKKLQEEFYTVVPSDVGIKEPFKVEKDVIFIPPFSFVRNNLQKMSAYEGLENDMVYNHAKRFLKFAENTMEKDKRKLLSPFKKMIKHRRTMSDEIIDLAKRKGANLKEKMSNKIAAEIALEHANRLYKEIALTRDVLRNLDE